MRCKAVTMDAVATPTRGLRLFTAAALSISLEVAPCWAQSCSAPSFAAPTSFAAVDGVAGTALADFNGDGRLDLLTGQSFAGTGELGLMLGDGAGGFAAPTSFPSGGNPYEIIAADFNRDGRRDVIVPGNGFWFVPATGPGTFGAPIHRAAVGVIALAVSDFDLDGKLDVAAALHSSTDSVVWLGNGDGTFGGPSFVSLGHTTEHLAVGDFNRDGRPDLLFAYRDSAEVSVVLGNGDGTFGAPTAYSASSWPKQVLVDDFNEDGSVDLAVVTDGLSYLDVRLGTGTGIFGPATSVALDGALPIKALLTDFNGDANADVVVTHADDKVSVLLGTGTGAFGAVTHLAMGSFPFGAAAGDIDRDGRADLVVALPYEDAVSVRLNGFGFTCPGPSFGPAARTSRAGDELGAAYGLASADFDGDGALDVVTTSAGSGGTGEVAVLLGDGAGGFSMGPGHALGGNSVVVAAADFNGDGRPDVAATLYDRVAVLLGTGGVGLSSPTYVPIGTGGNGIATGDFDADGHIDLAVTWNDFISPTGGVSILMGDGTGGFTATGLGLAGRPNGVGAGDLNNDGRQDLVLADSTGQLWRLIGNGAGGFTSLSGPAIGGWLADVAIGDFNRDGNVDAATVKAGTDYGYVAWGDGAGGLGGVISIGLGPSAYSQTLDAGDLDGDGDDDLVFGTAYSIAIVEADGTGGFAPAVHYRSGQEYSSVVIRDFVKDGYPDVAGTIAAGRVSVAAGAGDGTFSEAIYSEVGYGAGVAAVTVGDWNRDGRPDIATTNQAAVHRDIAISLGAGDGTFGAATFLPLPNGTYPNDITNADLNRDGATDLIVAEDNAISVYLGDGAGGFGAGVAYPGGNRRIGVGDFDGDGKLDVVAYSGFTNVAVLPGRGDGTLAAAVAFGIGAFSESLAVADLNRDGVSDVVVGFPNTDGVAVLLGTGNGSYLNARVNYSTGGGVPIFTPFDIDHDGDLDLITHEHNNGFFTLLRGDGTGGFGPPSPLEPLGALYGGLVVGDFNRDGRDDLVATTTGHIEILTGTVAGGLEIAGGFHLPSSGGAAADLDRDGRLDLISPGGDGVSVLMNTHCRARRLLVSSEVSSCNTPGVPFGVQPALRVADDGANTVRCATGNVTASIASGTGSAGASLGGAANRPVVSGLATYTDLSVDLAGRGYRLELAYPPVGTARTRTFSQGLSVTISGPAEACEGTSAVFSAGTDYDTYAWTLDGGPVFSTVSQVTLSGLGVGLHTLQVLASQDGCPDTDTRVVEIAAALSAVTVSMSGSSAACTACTGGTATAVNSDGGSSTRQWGYRTASGGAVTDISGATAGTYVLNGADFPGPGQYFLVETSTPACGGAMVSNEIPVSIYTAVAGNAVTFLTVTSKDGENVLEWKNPAVAGYAATRIQYNVGAPDCTAPTTPFDGTSLVRQVGTAGAHDTVTHSALANDTTYCYAAFVEVAGPSFGTGRARSGRPMDTSLPVKWAFSTGATSMAPASISGNALYAASNDNVFYAMTRSTTGGLWPAGWTPYLLGAPVQHRVPIVATNLIPPATRVSFLGAQDGSIQAVNAATGAQLWQNTLPSGGIQATPVGMFTSFGGIVNHLLVGTWKPGDNFFYALDATSGNVVSTFTELAGGIGIVSGSPLVDYPNRRVYFASHDEGSGHSLWCLQITATGTTATCTGWTHPDLGDIEVGVTRRNGRLYVGNTTGTIYAIDENTGAPIWSFDTGDGSPKGLLFPDRLSDKVYFATNTKVWALDDTGTPAWPEVAIPGPSPALFTPGSRYLIVGGNDGRLYQLDVAAANPTTPPTVTSVTVGDGTAALGAPTLDTTYNLVYVGSDAGIVYAVQLPLP